MFSTTGVLNRGQVADSSQRLEETKKPRQELFGFRRKVKGAAGRVFGSKESEYKPKKIQKQGGFEIDRHADGFELLNSEMGSKFLFFNSQGAEEEPSLASIKEKESYLPYSAAFNSRHVFFQKGVLS